MTIYNDAKPYQPKRLVSKIVFFEMVFTVIVFPIAWYLMPRYQEIISPFIPLIIIGLCMVIIVIYLDETRRIKRGSMPI